MSFCSERFVYGMDCQSSGEGRFHHYVQKKLDKYLYIKKLLGYSERAEEQGELACLYIKLIEPK